MRTCSRSRRRTSGPIRHRPRSSSRAGSARVAGDRLVQKDLAATLRQIGEAGAAGFYKGPVAAAIVASSRAGGGIITQADLDQYTTRELAPIECDYRGFRVVSAPPPSSGGVVICEILNVLEGYPLKDLGFRSAQAVHFQIEAMRHAYVDRNSYLGDPDFVQNPLRAAARQGLCGEDPRRDRSGQGRRVEGSETRRRCRTRASTRRTTRSSTARATRSR